MARILIAEPDQEVGELFARVLAGAGHRTELYQPGADAPEGELVVVLEPAFAPALELVKQLRESRPEVVVVCASILPPSAACTLEPVAWLVKPFPLAELVDAVAAAI